MNVIEAHDKLRALVLLITDEITRNFGRHQDDGYNSSNILRNESSSAEHVVLDTASALLVLSL